MACIAPHGQNQRVPAKLIDDMYLSAQERRVCKAREMDFGEREAKETLPINMCWKTPASSLPSKLVSHEKGEGMCGNEHIRVFRHFPNEPCVLACMMLKGLRLDPSTPMPCEHVWLMLEGFHIMLHVLLHVGLMFHPSNQDVLEECRFKLLIKTYRWNQTHDKETTDIIICVAKHIFVSFAISPCFLSPCLPARFCELSRQLNTQVDNELNTQVDNELNT